MPEPRGEVMSEADVSSFIQRKILRAMNDEDGDISEVRMDVFDYYVGEEYGNERDGGSSYVSRETLEVIEWAKPSIMRTLVQDKVVQFDPVGPEDEAQADQETDVANHVIMKENKGFLQIYQWVNDILMYPNGYIKVWPEQSEEVVKHSYRQQTMPQVAMIMESPDTEILEANQYTIIVNNNGQMEQIEVADLEVEETRQKRSYKLAAMPPDGVLVDEDLASPDLDEADFICHRFRKNYTDIVNGFPEDKRKEWIEKLQLVGSTDDHRWQDEEVNRRFHEDENPDNSDEDDDSMREYLIHECYARFDYDGTGLSQRRKVMLIGQSVFDNEELDYQPFVSASTIIMSHKHVGMSLGEIVSDLQLLRSMIRRHILDNADRMNFPKKYVGEGAITDGGETIDDLLDHDAEIIRCADASQIVPEQFQSMIGDLLLVDQSLKEELQNRTGIAPHLSLDPKVLQQATAGAFMGALEQANQRIELLVRLIAEVGMRPLFQKVHQLLRQYQDVEKTVKIRNEWVNVNPRDWIERENISVTVGLGFHGKPQKLMLLDAVAAKQEKLIGAGMVEPQHVFNTLEDMVETGELGDTERYFKKPQEGEQWPQQENPQEGIVAATVQIEQGKARVKAKEVEGKHNEQMSEMQLKFDKQAKDHTEAMREFDLKWDETQAKIGQLEATTRKLNEETRQLDIESDAAESGVDALIQEVEDATANFG